jgi:hypothetical protein
VNITGLDSSQTASPGQTVVFTGAINDAIEDGPAAFTFSFSGYDSSDLTPESLLLSPFSIGGGLRSISSASPSVPQSGQEPIQLTSCSRELVPRQSMKLETQLVKLRSRSRPSHRRCGLWLLA